MAKKFVDDKIIHLESDSLKMRKRFMQYISFSNDKAAKSIVIEILMNAIDECLNSRSPGDTIEITFDEAMDTIHVKDNGRGIPSDALELLLTTLNSGSNIDSTDKKALKTSGLGRNGVGTLAMQALAERLHITTYRGGTENIWKSLTFVESEKIEDKTGKCSPDKHGLDVYFKPSKILGRHTRIIWSDIHSILSDLQFLLNKKINISSTYIDKKGEVTKEKYKVKPFSEIITARNNKESVLTKPITISIGDDKFIEEVAGTNHERFILMNIVFAYTNQTTPYIDSFCNQNNTIDNGDHLDAAIEAINRYFQVTVRNSMSEKEREKLDIKWEDIQNGLSIAVNLNSDIENMFTNQSKHKISKPELFKDIKELMLDELKKYFDKNQDEFKALSNIIKINARVRRDGEKVKAASIKGTVTNWAAFKKKNYDPCINRGKAYKELFIIEGDSAKGSLKLARDPVFQALFAIRGVSLNVFKADDSKIANNNEFYDLIHIMGCGSGKNFDLSKLQFDKIIIASDADIDGLNIRSLLCGFFFKLFPEIVADGRLFIAEPPLYRVDDKKSPFVINKEDYISRYITAVIKDYEIGLISENDDVDRYNRYMDKIQLRKFLSATSFYLDTISLNASHYKINEKLLEIIYSYLGKKLNVMQAHDSARIYSESELISVVDYNELMVYIQEVFSELIYSKKENIIKGAIDGKYQSIEINSRLIRKGMEIISIFAEYELDRIILKHKVDTSINVLTPMEALKVLRKYQPNIVHRFKGLGENDHPDIKTTVMDPNTRMLIRCTTENFENDLKLFSILRGGSPVDALARKNMIREYLQNTSYRELMEIIDT